MNEHLANLKEDLIDDLIEAGYAKTRTEALKIYWLILSSPFMYEFKAELWDLAVERADERNPYRFRTPDTAERITRGNA